MTFLSVPSDPPPPAARFTTVPTVAATSRPTTADTRAAVGALFHQHQIQMVRVATVLVRDPAVAEDVVQDAFLAVYANWSRIREKDEAVRYLHRSVVNVARNRLRRRSVVERLKSLRHHDEVSAEDRALGAGLPSALLVAVAELPRRERETVLLRYYLDLSEKETAEALGLRPGSVKGYASRGLAKLRSVLEPAICGEER
ncbi:SigE family RNA polymerase sigma factor [Kineosporia mesophila]|uniref:SigE family RNA polymerase sigma factor n=1 Tax=Kineosporia mesophila TaxID=566012 RepID=A0ABP7ANM2_9ACTN|nr:SigE family RNA polymerase sigma factor [Kineosporia mesophila]